MAKDSRPDIQVLEDRIVRLKSQLLQYKDSRLYRSTKQRLSAVATELSECISIIHSITDVDINNIQPSSISVTDESGPVVSEFDVGEDNDLLDAFSVSLCTDSPNSSIQYSARTIVSMYGTRINEGYDSNGSNTGILQVNQFWTLLYSWYTERYIPKIRNPRFHFKADRIHEWIDLLILSAGRALHEKKFSQFIQSFNNWIKTLNTPRDELYALPYAVIQAQVNQPEYCTFEAVLLEYIIKPSLYDSSFYPNQLDSIRNIVKNNTNLSIQDLCINNVVEKCSHTMICTSLFDISKYGEVI